MNYIKDVPLKANQSYNMIVEIMKGTNHKDELVYPLFNELTNGQKVKYKYPYNYGVMPGTLGDDGDPIDCILWSDPRKPLTVHEVEVVGMVKTTDDKGYDPKIICAPVSNKLSDRQKVKLVIKTRKFINKFKKFKNIEIDQEFYGLQDATIEIKNMAKKYRDAVASGVVIKSRYTIR